MQLLWNNYGPLSSIPRVTVQTSLEESSNAAPLIAVGRDNFDKTVHLSPCHRQQRPSKIPVLPDVKADILHNGQSEFRVRLLHAVRC